MMQSSGRVPDGDGADMNVADGGARLHRIRHLLAWQFGVDPATIGAATDLVDQLYADSLDLMEMTQVLNRHFDIEIGPQQLARMRTVADVERVVAAMPCAAAASQKNEQS